MKTIFTAMGLIFMMTLHAQPEVNKTATPKKMTAEQRAELQSKRLSLQLELNDAQQAQVQKVLVLQFQKADQKRAAHQQDRAEGNTPKTLSADERFELQNQRLDEQMAMQEEMKKILSPEQLEKWKEIRKDRNQKGKRLMAKRHMRNKHRRGGN